jgi:hypothetical protein
LETQPNQAIIVTDCKENKIDVLDFCEAKIIFRLTQVGAFFILGISHLKLM